MPTDATRARLAGLEFDGYWRAIGGLLGGAAGLLACDADGAPVWHSEGLPGNALEAALGATRAVGSTADRVTAEVPGGGRVDLAVLRDGAGEPAGWVGLVSDGNAPAGPGAALDALAALMSREFASGAELDAMATELGARYDELALVFEARDEGEGTDLAGTVAALARRCAEHLGLGLAVVTVPGAGGTVVHENPEHPLDDAAALAAGLETHLLPWMLREQRSVVVNDPGDPMRPLTLDHPDHRLAACPVVDASGRVIGLVAGVRAVGRPDFTNSDRNLLDVQARLIGQAIESGQDRLTGLASREAFEIALARAVESARAAQQVHALLYLDVDRVQVVNDSAGHEAGDALLRHVAAALRHEAGTEGRAARLAGDHFALLLPRTPLDEGVAAARRVRDALRAAPFAWRDRRFDVSVRTGVAAITPDSTDAGGALSAAEVACRDIHTGDLDRVRVVEEDDARFREHQSAMRQLSRAQLALQEGRFELSAQAIRGLRGDPPELHHELLVRLIDEDGERVLPEEFIPVAERYGLMPGIDRWVVREACRILGEHYRLHARVPGIWSVNLSGQSLGEPAFREFALGVLAESGAPPASICFEVTETAAVENVARAQEFIAAMQALGCSFALDDFGVGLSSFSYLASLPVNFLKIDGSFVRRLGDDKAAAALVSAISRLGHELGMESIAECAESEAIIGLLEGLGVDYAQGWGVGRPEPLAGRLRALAGAGGPGPAPID